MSKPPLSSLLGFGPTHLLTRVQNVGPSNMVKTGKILFGLPVFLQCLGSHRIHQGREHVNFSTLNGHTCLALCFD